jgi:hypothetical protein
MDAIPRRGMSSCPRLDEYLFAVRGIETQIEAAERSCGRSLPNIAEPGAGYPASLSEHARLMLDLLAIAFQAGITHVATLILRSEANW